ncbi:hypothetical protein G7K_0884-t1 [Saitoella complicata NRRL Y-17804]|uniref:Uncharacterized protein n=1 Tax=Saitoella complicata (strain BCRC 22490 / CBS 7301 / JCM 7358 / NBRC 10748 / NRRL Y-17804) TaxID=698492 RepID=A0A0E9NA36_SAICN|nr:hypothetical protein G7K_0884-t1 [Saitoella complicata NRRL Y-17804]
MRVLRSVISSNLCEDLNTNVEPATMTEGNGPSHCSHPLAPNFAVVCYHSRDAEAVARPYLLTSRMDQQLVCRLANPSTYRVLSIRPRLRIFPHMSRVSNHLDATLGPPHSLINRVLSHASCQLQIIDVVKHSKSCELKNELLQSITAGQTSLQPKPPSTAGRQLPSSTFQPSALIFKPQPHLPLRITDISSQIQYLLIPTGQLLPRTPAP